MEETGQTVQETQKVQAEQTGENGKNVGMPECETMELIMEPHLKFCPLCLCHAVVVFNQRIYNGIFAERNKGVTRCCRNLFLNL